MQDSQSLSHTKWNCKYHIVFAPKFRRQAIYLKLEVLEKFFGSFASKRKFQ